ncbi:hypothetical protein FA13DRAFT_1793976 [Coprinellus micaceus]|uniref:Uncharacterized protein n=1 Tax=Coprinellus micaceus TaxID=71717 RepID=A0A4Y7T2X6_COPMI|nr:hypothetical protein FA13DRAFT_1793976 [Coprinellus micaceus]
MALTTDCAHPTPAEVLGHPQKLLRLKTALADGVFSPPADEASATQIIDKCMKVCGGSSETLSELLQTPFLASRTPFYWAIVNHDPAEPDLNAATQADIVQAFFVEYDSDLYHAVQPYIARSNVGCYKAGGETLSTRLTSKGEGGEGNGGKECPRVMASSYVADNVEKATIEFRIPKFFRRMLTEGKVAVQFLVMGRIWSLKARVQTKSDALGSPPSEHPCWFFELTEIWHSFAQNAQGKFSDSESRLAQQLSWRTQFDILDPEGQEPPLPIYSNREMQLGSVKPIIIAVPADKNANLRTLRWRGPRLLTVSTPQEPVHLQLEWNIMRKDYRESRMTPEPRETKRFSVQSFSASAPSRRARSQPFR